MYIPQHDQFNKLAETCLQKRVVVDQFVMGSTALDLATFSVISNLTGGAVNFYSISSNDIRIKFEKLHFDLSRILTRPNYYDVRFMIRCSLGLNAPEIIGPFNRKIGQAFALSSCDPDYSFAYNLRLSESLKSGEPYHLQLVCLYIDNFNERYLRIFNYTFIPTTDTAKIYASVDTDSLAKITIMKEINLCYQSDTATNRDNLRTKIVNSFSYYRNQVFTFN